MFRIVQNRLANGDREALRILHAMVAPAFRTALRQRKAWWSKSMRRQCDPEEVMQAAWLAAWARLRAGKRFGNPRELLRYLLAVARHRVIDAARHAQAARRDLRREQDCASAPREVPGNEPDPAAEAAAQEQLAVFLARLPAEQGAAVQGRLDGLSTKDIALRLGMSVRKVEVLLKKAKKHWPS